VASIPLQRHPGRRCSPKARNDEEPRSNPPELKPCRRFQSGQFCTQDSFTRGSDGGRRENSEFRSSGVRIQNTEYRIQNRELRTLNSKLRTGAVNGERRTRLTTSHQPLAQRTPERLLLGEPGFQSLEVARVAWSPFPFSIHFMPNDLATPIVKGWVLLLGCVSTGSLLSDLGRGGDLGRGRDRSWRWRGAGRKRRFHLASSDPSR
jgi:hypothetical protein